MHRIYYLLAALFLLPQLALAEEQTYPLKTPPRQHWSFSGIFGIYDKAQLQRGLKIYAETCSACHSLNYVHFRDLEALGYSSAQIKEFAARYSYKTTNVEGSPTERKGSLNDHFPDPYENVKRAAFANNGAVPPDLSLMARARAVPHPFAFITDFLTNYDSQGADYISALLTGYTDPPAHMTIATGQYYNPYFINGVSLAMPPLLQDGLIEYDDGTMQTKQQYARDIAAFLTWTADPHRVERHKIGFAVLLFLLTIAVLVYGLKREIWANKAQTKINQETKSD